MLNLNDAFHLYELINPFLPETTEEMELLEFAGKIVDNIIQTENHTKFVEILGLMYSKSREEILQIKPEDAIVMFMEGLVENNILWLKKFCMVIGYA